MRSACARSLAAEVSGRTPLHNVATDDRAEVMAVRLERRADVNLRDEVRAHKPRQCTTAVWTNAPSHGFARVNDVASVLRVMRT